MYSFGFQQAFRRGIQPEDQLLLDKVRYLLAYCISAFIQENLVSVSNLQDQ